MFSFFGVWSHKNGLKAYIESGYMIRFLFWLSANFDFKCEINDGLDASNQQIL